MATRVHRAGAFTRAYVRSSIGTSPPPLAFIVSHPTSSGTSAAGADSEPFGHGLRKHVHIDVAHLGHIYAIPVCFGLANLLSSPRMRSHVFGLILQSQANVFAAISVFLFFMKTKDISLNGVTYELITKALLHPTYYFM